MASDKSTPAPLMVSISGCRGIVGASLTPEVVCRFVGAFVHWLRADCGRDDLTVVLGRDGRQGGKPLQMLARGALCAGGVRVIDLDVAMTPTVGVMVRHHAADGGLVLTASHNPQEWNGMKALTADGRAPGPAGAAAIVEAFRSNATALAPHDRVGTVGADDTAAHVHVARVLSAIENVASVQSISDQQFDVVIDSVNASGAAGARLLLDGLGCRSRQLHGDRSGVFPHAPEPVAAHLSGLCDAVREHGAAMGFAQDPDADRLAIVDGEGRYIGEEYTLALSARALLSSLPDPAGVAVAVNFSTSRMIDDVAAEFGARVVRTPVGEANVVEAMQEDDACVISGEGNGGVIWPRVCLIRDSLSAMALTLALVAKERRSLAEGVASMPRYAIVKRKAPAPTHGAAGAIDAVRRRFSDGQSDLQDGLRIDFPEKRSWVQVRASNTEPVLRIIAEAPDGADAERLVDDAERALSSSAG